MRRLLLSIPLLTLFAGSRPAEVPFKVHTLDLGAAEAADIADINRDGKLDVIAGEFWYEAPSWKQHRFREVLFTNNYIDALTDLVIDVDRDGNPDLVTAGWFSKKIGWWRNPGKGSGAWKETAIETGFNTEFAFLVDLNNDGKREELLPQFGNKEAPLAWYELRAGAWEKHVVNPQSWGHGIGAGDVNRDGRADILVPKGWFEAPADVRKGDWKFHSDWNENSLGFLHVLDVNGDGHNDVVTSNAHDYGIFWLEQTADGKFVKRVIDDSWSQAHAVVLADLNHDGQLDLLTGKRFMAHNGRDPGEKEPLGVYWYEYRKDQAGKIEWTKHVVEYGGRIGGGVQIPTADLDGDGDLDFVCAGKSGLFLFENLTNKSKAK